MQSFLKRRLIQGVSDGWLILQISRSTLNSDSAKATNISRPRGSSISDATHRPEQQTECWIPSIEIAQKYIEQRNVPVPEQHVELFYASFLRWVNRKQVAKHCQQFG